MDVARWGAQPSPGRITHTTPWLFSLLIIQTGKEGRRRSRKSVLETRQSVSVSPSCPADEQSDPHFYKCKREEKEERERVCLSLSSTDGGWLYRHALFTRQKLLCIDDGHSSLMASLSSRRFLFSFSILKASSSSGPARLPSPAFNTQHNTTLDPCCISNQWYWDGAAQLVFSFLARPNSWKSQSLKSK